MLLWKASYQVLCNQLTTIGHPNSHLACFQHKMRWSVYSGEFTAADVDQELTTKNQKLKADC